MALVAGARDLEPVRGLTHGFYKYPARFSPAFVRAAIQTFTNPGDFCLDPHVGGGTTLVEALAAGRNAIGVDISALAGFVANVKSTVYSEAELIRLDAWAKRLPHNVDIHKSSVSFPDYADLGYYKHLDHPSRWRLRKAIEQGMASAIRLGTPRLESFGRCVVLRAAQRALDGRSRHTTVDEFRDFLLTTAAEMVEGARELRTIVNARGGRRSTIAVINRSAAGLEDDERLRGWRSPKLVVTSPPYPGVHVLYHRWQVDGRKEAPLPFMIANKLDGAGSSHYTMGDRKYPELKTYFNNIRATMSSVAALANKRTTVVQMIAFSEPDWQLERYLETMEEAGLTEAFLPALKREGDGRLWRSVPGRRWYSDQRGETPGSREVVLIHRKAEGAPARRAAQAFISRPRPSA
jgi:DNA modification methylase